jgi:signal transduction histidine kinase
MNRSPAVTAVFGSRPESGVIEVWYVDMPHRRALASRSRLAQRTGFGIIIALLLLSTLMAWGVQETFSNRSVRIHRQFMQQQDLLTGLRRTLWTVGLLLRDYYLDPNANAQEYESRLAALSADASGYITELDKFSSHSVQVGDLKRSLNGLISQARVSGPSHTDPAARYAFIQREIIPRRDEAGRLLREIESATHSSLTESEARLQETRSAASNLLIATLGTCLLAGIVVAFFSIRDAEFLSAEAAQRYDEVAAAKRELERLSSRLMEVQEEERTRLSRELHDEIVQNLAVLKMEIVKAQSLASDRVPGAKEVLARARGLADETVRTVRNISLLLRPSLLDDLGLGPALQWQAEEFSRRTGIACSLVEQDLRDDLPDAVKTCVYRVTQEALRNCEKHSHATSVKVRVEQHPADLCVIVEDNGCGIDRVARKPDSLGLLGMHERASALGGKVDIENRTEGGTVLRLSLPLAQAAGKSENLELGVSA